jgi:hypothetical protein
MIMSKSSTLSRSTLRAAIVKGNLKAIRHLHDRGFDFPHWVLPLAAQYGHLDLVEFLFWNRDDGGRIEDARDEAKDEGHESVVKFLNARIREERSGYSHKFV